MRILLLGPIAAFTAALVLAVAAVLSFLAPESMILPWLLVAGGVFTFVIGTRAQSAAQDEVDRALGRKSEIALLEARLENQQSSIDALADGLEIAVFICDAGGAILYANRSAMDMFRFDGPGKSVLAVTLSYDLEELVVLAGKLQEPKSAELSFKFPEERVGVAKAWTHPQGGRVFLSIYEITELRRLERIRQDFVANVSHEFRTPMTIIRAMAETLLDDDATPSDRAENYLQRIIAEVDRLSLISNDLLILSTAESNIVRKHACDIATVFKQAVKNLRQKAEERGLTLTYSGEDSCLIEANGIQMTQVAMNLVENAINYTPVGQVGVELLCGRDEIKVMVSDTGIGIASDQLPRIFERFYRVDKGRSRVTGGTGLGLSIVKHIVEAHGGAVTVQSGLHVGSTFTVTLPAGALEL